MRRAMCRVTAVAWAASLVGCLINISELDRDLEFEVAEPFTFQVDAAALERVELDAVNGTISIVGDPSTGVATVTGQRRVRSDSRDDAEDFLSRVSVEVLDQGDELTVRTLQPGSTNGREVVVDYDVVIPARLTVFAAHTNGPVELESIDGSVRVDLINGSVGTFDLRGDLVVNLINGDVVADVVPPVGGLVDLAVTNGTVTLDVPRAVSAMLEADVVNGTISIVGLTVLDATTSTRSLHGRLGGGDGLIDLNATNGTITVRAR